MSDKNIQIALILSAYDRASGVIGSFVANSQKKLGALQQSADKVANSAFKFGKDAGIVGAALAAPLVYATNKAIAFEDAMADVAKVYNTKIGSTEFQKFGEQAKDLSEYLSKSAEESALLMASLGQGGVESANLKKVSEAAGEIAVAFDLSADIAGERYTKLKNALNQSWDETKRVTDAINYLSDNQASKASEILDFMAAGGAGVARASKAAGQDLAAMGSYLISVGKSGAEGATIMERFYKGIMKNSESRQMFLGAGGGSEGFLAVLQQGANIGDAGQKFEYFKRFGEYSTEIMSMANNMDQLKGSIDSVGDSTSYAGSVNKEFLNRNSTTRGQINKAWAQFNRIVLDFGENGLPIIIQFLQELKPIVSTIAQFMKNNKELTGTIFKVIGGLSLFTLGVSGVSFAVGGIAKTISVFTQIASLNLTAIWASVKAFWAFNAALWANPITWIVAGVIALGVAFYLAYTKCDKFRAVIQGVIAVGRILGQVFMATGKVILGALTFNPSMMMSGVKETAALAKSIAGGAITQSFKQAYNQSLSGGGGTSSKNSKGLNLSGIANTNSSISPNKSSSPVNLTVNINGPVNKDTVNTIGREFEERVKKVVNGMNQNKTRVAY